MSSINNSTSVLRDSAIAISTLKKYKKAVHNFLIYSNEQGENIQNGDDLDDLLSEYIDHLYIIGSSLSTANNTKNGIQHYYPRLINSLSESNRRIQGWNRLSVHIERPPLTKELATVIAITMVKSGYYNAGLATLLAFDCYLRIGELTQLKISDIALPINLHFGLSHNGMALHLKKTKTGKNQFVKVESIIITELIELLIEKNYKNGSISTDSLFNLTMPNYRKLFKQTCLILNISGFGFVPHSLRHGGATSDFLKGKSIESILFRGRWAATMSARTYIHSGQALLVNVNASYLQLLGIKLDISLLQIMKSFL